MPSPHAALRLVAHPWFAWCLLSLPVIIIYGNFLERPLVFDDFAFIQSTARSDSYLSDLLHLRLRSLPYATFEWARTLFGQNLAGWHSGNLLLHLGVITSLWLLLHQLFNHCLPAVSGARTTLTPDWLAFFAALIFALHPVSVYAVAYLNQRSTIMATLFTLLMWHYFAKGLLRERYAWLWLSVALYMLAVLSKEHAVTAPAVCIVLLLLLKSHLRPHIAKLLPIFIAYGLIAIFVVLQMRTQHVLGEAYQAEGKLALAKLELTTAPPPTTRINTDSNKSDTTTLTPSAPLQQNAQENTIPQQDVLATSANTQMNTSHLLSIITEAFLFFKYLGLWLLPNTAWMSIDMFYPFITRINSFPELLGCIAFIIYPVIAIRYLLQREHRGLLGFALLCPWLLFTTEFTVIRVQETFVLYRSYLWMAGSFAALPFLCQKLSARTATLCLTSIAVLLMPLTWQRLSTFADPIALWTDAAKLVEHSQDNLPGVERIFYNRGVFLKNAHRDEDAIADFSKTIALGNDQGYLTVNAYYNRGRIYMEQQHYQLAADDFNKAITLEPKNNDFYFLKGLALEKLNDNKGAEQAYKENFLRSMPFLQQ